MIRITVILAILFSLVGCDVVTSNGTHIDQCARLRLFNSCLMNAPKMPAVGDRLQWRGVIDSCDEVSIYQSIRRAEFIEDSCRE